MELHKYQDFQMDKTIVFFLNSLIIFNSSKNVKNKNKFLLFYLSSSFIARTIG